MVRKRIGWLASLATAITMVVLPAAPAAAQETNGYYEVPPPQYLVPSPLGHPGYEKGGFYFVCGFKFFMQTNPLKQQNIAIHGFQDLDGSVSQAIGIPNNQLPGVFVGDLSAALDVNQVSGPLTFVPGYDFTLGWRFESGVALEFNWFHLQDARYAASATQALNVNANPGVFQENTFLFAPVFNFPNNYNGPINQVGIGNAGATFGIWNAATNMSIDFVQRFDQYQFNVRYPLQQTDSYRLYGLFGPRLVAMWERFHWRTVDSDVNGQAGSQDQANYANIVSNRLYGVHIGCGNEWLLSTTPIGAFALSVDLEAAGFVNFVTAQSKYELGDLSTSARRNRNFTTLVPEVQGSLNLWWYPYEGIQVKMGYDAMLFFNTMSSPRPVDFNMGALDPGWERNTIRFMNGLSFNVALIF